MSDDRPQVYYSGKCGKGKHWQCHHTDCGCPCHVPESAKELSRERKRTNTGFFLAMFAADLQGGAHKTPEKKIGLIDL